MSEARPQAAPSRGFYRWYMLSILFGIYIFQSVDRAVISVIVEPLKQEFGFSDGQIGFLSGLAYSLTFAIAVLPSGWLVDRANRKVFLASLVSIWSLCTAAGAFATQYAHLVATRLGVGAAEAGAVPASLSLIADTFPPERRNTAIGIYYSGTAAGQLVTFLIGGWLLTMFTWRSVFMIAGLPGLALGLLAFLTLKEPVRGAFEKVGSAVRQASEKAKKGPSLRQTAREITRSPHLIHAILANMISTGVAFAMMVWTVSFLVRVHDLPVHQAAIWVGLGVGLVQTVGSLVIGPVADSISRGDPAKLAMVPCVATLGCAVFGVSMALSPSLAVALAVMSAVALCNGFFTGPSYSLLVSLAAPDARGSTLAIAKLISILIGNSGLTYLTGRVSDAVGGPHSIRVALVVTFLFHFWGAFHYFAAGRAARARRSTPELAAGAPLRPDPSAS